MSASVTDIVVEIFCRAFSKACSAEDTATFSPPVSSVGRPGRTKNDGD